MMKRLISLLLVVITVVLVISSLSACSSKSNLSEPSKDASVDFGCLLEEGDKIAIEKVKPAPVDSDVEIYAYDFKLSSGQPGGAIELTLPYDDKGLEEDEEILSICGKYLNKQTGEWEDVFYTVDTEANEVRIITDHLSTYSVFKIINPTKRSAYISDVNVYAAYMTTVQAEAVLKAYAAQGASWQEDVVGSFLGATGTLEYFTATSVPTLLTLGGAYDDLISSPLGNSLTMLGVTTSCAQFAFDAYNNGLDSKAASISGMKSVLNLALNLATEPIQLAYVGVGVIDIALTEVSTFAIDNKYQSTKNMYDAYYSRPENKRKVRDWLKLFEKMYKENKSDPQAALDMMTAEVDRYTREYWEVAGSDWESWIDAYDKNGKLSKYPWPSEEDRVNISNTYKAELYEYLQAVFHTMSRNMYLDSLTEREKEFNELAALLNRKYTITIKEQEVSGKSPQWAGCYVKLAPLSDNTDASAWTIKLDDKANGKFAFTLLAHQTAGFPMKLEFYKTADDLDKGKVAATAKLKPFTKTEKTFTIKTEVEKINYSGTYTGVLSVTETGADIDVTTIITYEKDFGDGAYYNIVCTNDETESKYINGSYFVRDTGKANIAGADFTFSQDGQSFSATMLDFNNKAWGSISAHK
ncbi:MAG TPA: hypothetical protein PLL98_05300 [Bacillota bacterium]|nr:hypothetical protein [Bacillota bacterium]